MILILIKIFDLLLDFTGLMLFIPFVPTTILLNKHEEKVVHGKKAKKEKSGVEKEKSEVRIPTEFEICKEYLLDFMEGKFIYDNEVSQWYKYDQQIWKAISEEVVKLHILNLLQNHKLIKNRIRPSYLTGVISFLKTLLNTDFREFSNQHVNYIPFSNGILDLTTSKLLPFSPDFKFTSKLNIDYNPKALMKKDFANWLLFISNYNPLFLDVLRAFVFLIFTRNNKLQIALYLWGPAGTGKSTFEKLMVSIVSREGTVGSDLKRLNSNFETAKLINKNLLLLSDIDDKRSDVNKLKLIISGDMVAAEKKFQQPFEFFPTCLTLISSNHIWLPTDTSSGIMRRIIYLNFCNIPTERDPELFYLDALSRPKGKLAESLSGFINWILVNPIDKLTLFTKDISKLNSELSPSVVNDTNPLLKWASESLVYVENSMAFIGNKQSPKETHLFPNYYSFCIKYGYTPMSFHKFSYSVLDLCLNEFKWKGVLRKVFHQGIGLTNININVNANLNQKDGSLLKSPNLDLSYFDGFVEGSLIDPTLFQGLSKYPVNPYTLKPDSSFHLSNYPINPYALSPETSDVETSDGDLKIFNPDSISNDSEIVNSNEDISEPVDLIDNPS